MLLQFWDNITAYFRVYATDFQNGNFYKTKRPASATDKTALDKTVLGLKALRDHFRQRIAVKQACNVKPTIAYLMEATDAPARPAECSQGGAHGAGNSAGTMRALSGGSARPEAEIGCN